MQLSMPGILGISISLFIGVLIWRLIAVAKKSGDSIGETMNQFFIDEGELLLIVLLISCYMAEAMIATSLHPHDEQIIDVAARFVSHLSINFFGFLSSALATKFVVDFFLAIKYFSSDKNEKGVVIRKANPALPIVLLGLAIIFVFSSFIIPYYNTNIISVGLSRSHEFEYAVHQILFFWKSDVQVAREFNYDVNRSTSEIMGYNMTASFVVFLAHLLGSAAEGFLATLNALVHGKRGYVGKYEDFMKKAKDGKKPEEKGKETKPKEPSVKPEEKAKEKEKEKRELSLYKNILSIFGQSEDWVTGMVSKIQSSYATMDLDEMQTVNSTLNDMNISIQQAKRKRNADEYTEVEYQSTLEEIRSEVRVFLEKPKPEGLEINMELD